MPTFRAAALTLLLLSTAAAILTVLISDAGPWQLASWLGRHGGPGYPAWIGWSLVAPALLAVGAALQRRTPWPWVVVAAIEVLAATVLVARFAQIVPWWLWAWWALVVCSGVVSIISSGRPWPASRRQSA